MHNNGIRARLAFGFLALVVVLCAATARAEDGQPPVTIRYAPMKGITSIGFWFGNAKGFFTKAGIDLKLVDVKDPIPALVSGDLDMAEANTSQALTACSRGAGIKMVSSLYRTRAGWLLVGGKGVASVADLKGKTVGIGTKGSGLDISVRETLVQNGIDPDKDVTLSVNGRHQQAYASLESGQVAATIIHQPFATIAEENGVGKILAKTWKFIPDFHTGVIVASDAFIAANPEAIRRMLKVYFDVNRYVKEPAHREEFLTWCAEFLHMDRALVEKALALDDELWENNPDIDLKMLDATQDLQIKWGMQSQKVDAAKYVDLQFIPKQ